MSKPPHLLRQVLAAFFWSGPQHARVSGFCAVEAVGWQAGRASRGSPSGDLVAELEVDGGVAQ